ncbi:MAG: NUDIX domain-containing protein [Alteraurantiacibacter sp.]
MFHLIPPPAHRLGLRVAHAIRRRFRRWAKPHVAGVSVLLHNGDERVLLVRHSYGPEGWAMPGGGLKSGEDAAEAARREMREELAVELDGLELLDQIEEILSGAPHTAHVYTAQPRGEVRVDGRELLEARWFERGKLAAVVLTRVTAGRLRRFGWL